jgi:D-alanyl-lipoteichoic acid acyltransferase DltB (MBOAT superfamily)
MFVIWGTIHGLYQLYERLTHTLREKIWKFIKLDRTNVQWLVKWSVTMLVVLVSWMFFRATSLDKVSQISFVIFSDLLDGSLLRDFFLLVKINPI